MPIIFWMKSWLTACMQVICVILYAKRAVARCRLWPHSHFCLCIVAPHRWGFDTLLPKGDLLLSHIGTTLQQAHKTSCQKTGAENWVCVNSENEIIALFTHSSPMTKGIDEMQQPLQRIKRTTHCFYVSLIPEPHILIQHGIHIDENWQKFRK